MKSFFLLFGCLLMMVESFAQQSVTRDAAGARIIEQLLCYPQEKIYVHTDKPYYMTGDTIWLRAHVADASTHTPVCASKYVYVEMLRDAKRVSGELPPEPVRIKILERDGVYAGYIPLPMTFAGGNYTLTAYTAFMRNPGPDYFYRTNIYVGKYGSLYEKEAERRRVESNFEVSFFPEGGYLIENANCCVGFKAMKSDGNSASITGCIVDDAGTPVISFESLHAGMGTVRFMPLPGRKYFAECTNSAGHTKRYDLPLARKDACVVQVFPTSTRFSVHVATSSGFDPGALTLLIHCRGALCYYEEWRAGASRAFERTDFPDGVLQLLLLDQKGNALSERLLFCYDPQRQPSVCVVPDKPDYGRREKVTLAAEFRDGAGNPLSGSFSVSVTDNRIVNPSRPSDIRTTLLLESELRGYIEAPAFYFDEQEPSRQAAVDALMLTQGWRRYDIPKVLRGHYAEPTSPLEIGQEITGRISKMGVFRKRTFRDYQVSMIVPGHNIFLSTSVDAMGRFSLNGFDLPDSAACVLRATEPDGGENLALSVDNESRPNLQKPLPVVDRSVRMESYNEHIRQFTDSLRNILIDEVVISAVARKVPTTPHEVLASRSVDYKQIEKEKYYSLEDALQRQHGVSIQQGWVFIFGKPASFMIDGTLWEMPYLMEGLADKIPLHIPLEMIKRIDIIPPVNTTLYGSAVSGGPLVYITTKTGEEFMSSKPDDSDRLNMQSVIPLGYQRPVEFYSPIYDTPEQKNVYERDLRTTLYWNPDLRVADGRASIEFYTGDNDADYTINFEGHTNAAKHSILTKTINL